MSFMITSGTTFLEGIGFWVFLLNVLLAILGIAILIVQHFGGRWFLSESTKRFAGFAITAHIGCSLLAMYGFSVGQTLNNYSITLAFLLAATIIEVLIWYFVYRTVKAADEQQQP